MSCDRRCFKVGDDHYGHDDGNTPRSVDCIGVDRKLHVCLPWENVTRCGMKIIKKNITIEDREGKFFCYECTY